MNKLIFTLMFFLVSLSSVNAVYYYERTESRSPDGSYASKEIEFRGSVSGYAEDSDYVSRRSCSRSDYRRAYVNKYYGRGYSDRCSGRYYSRPVTRSIRTYNDVISDSYYNYRGRDTIRTSRY